MTMRQFDETISFNWETLEKVGLGEEVHRFLNLGAWHRLFDISNPTYQEITLEVLAMFTVAKGALSWHHAYQI